MVNLGIHGYSSVGMRGTETSSRVVECKSSQVKSSRVESRHLLIHDARPFPSSLLRRKGSGNSGREGGVLYMYVY